MSLKLFEDLLKIVIRTFYDEAAIVVLDYILYYKNVEEHQMSEALNLPFKRVRQALIEMGENSILICREGRRDRRHEERSGNMFTRGPDIGKMVYWGFNPDIKNVICCRIVDLKESLEKLVDDARQILYKCEKCHRDYSVEDAAISRFTCNFCQGSPLVQKLLNVTEALDQRDRGIQQIRLLESQMRNCLNIDLPPSFFGIMPDVIDEPRPANRAQSYRAAPIVDGSSRNYTIAVNLPEADEEKRDDTEELKDVDRDLMRYYHRFERRNKKRKKVTENNENLQKFNVLGNPVTLSDITPQLQAEMTASEHFEFSRSIMQNLKFL
ncbi:unnamed protein product [Blepharisma stoltei]|uniref:TFIIEalpha/SarR/Rpc3 HTH domain-containing protein n=1 Tax=Blepharisma stoltei TaxID=1481888 RepID=A0AAU9J0B7_9CILI|nr:unnamed protein product [Blepharisma stoltei]